VLSRENTVIAVFASTAVLALVGIDSVADPASWQQIGLLLGLGVLVPMLVNNYLDARETA
jgi:hypothetical protein